MVTETVNELSASSMNSMTPSVSASVPSQVESSPSASKPKQKIDPTPAFDHQSASPDSVKDPPEVVVTPPAVEAPVPNTDNLSNR